MDKFARKIFDSKLIDVESARNLIQMCRWNDLFSLAVLFYRKFKDSLLFDDLVLLHELSICEYYCGLYKESYQRIQYIFLKFPFIETKLFDLLKYNIRFAYSKVEAGYIEYPKCTVNIRKENKYMYAFSITTCKRFDLFTRTMNSFLNTCTDVHLFDKWICVDDNSTEEDRLKMKSMYPFFTFINKDESSKGHAKSMNIILEESKDYKYLFHMEDDWQFFSVLPYVTICTQVLLENETYGQCLINQNYAETEACIDIYGGIQKFSSSGIRYRIHEYYPDENAEETKEFYNKASGKKTCAYWPHYSLRPSLIRREYLNAVGKYNETAPHFEMEYAARYTSCKIFSVFLEGYHSRHIGRLTSERNDTSKVNAYKLNNEQQFNKVEVPKIQFDMIKSYVINMKSRKDRYSTFLATNKDKLTNLNPERFDAVSGKDLVPTPGLRKLFEMNDYLWRRGMIGCSLSHMLLWTEHMKSDDKPYLLVFEDDAKCSNYFEEKLKDIISSIPEDWDILFLGHLLKNNTTNNFDNTIKIFKIRSYADSLKISLGGTHCYVINKSGISKLLAFFQDHQMIHGIDTMIQKSIDSDVNVYYTHPILATSEAFSSDSDIQLKAYTEMDLMRKGSIFDQANELRVYFSRYGYNVYIINENSNYKIDKKINNLYIIYSPSELKKNKKSYLYYTDKIALSGNASILQSVKASQLLVDKISIIRDIDHIIMLSK
jgi:GR25 family glycosyltransferase involved in LPS biosynthesis